MGNIIKLPETIVAQIAAGEVIERPCYAVKELVENAIDAKATHIKIDIEDAGLKKIVVIDNGVGMDEHDLTLCAKPHTTSKLFDSSSWPRPGSKSVERLTATDSGQARMTNLSHTFPAIKSLGFRGEALSSIASIANLVIASRQPHDDQGKKVEFMYGDYQGIAPIGIPHGTTVTITNLFGSVPARKKFLKSERTEARHSIEQIVNLALANPHIRFQLAHNGKPQLDLFAGQALFERLAILLGPAFSAKLLPISYQGAHCTISGFVGHPQLAPSMAQQYLYVNNRRVNDSLVTAAVKEAYGVALPSKVLPSYVLFITLPFDSVDVNVHPRKEQIKFIEANFVLQATRQAVMEVLDKTNLTFVGSLTQSEDQDNIYPGRDTESFAGLLLKDTVKPQTGLVQEPDKVTQIHNCYLVFQSPNGMVLIDQHAAHERILYERYVAAFTEKQQIGNIYRLKKPIQLDVSLEENAVIEEHTELLQSLGFELEAFGSNTYRVIAVPELFKDRNIAVLLHEMLEDLAVGEVVKAIDSKTDRMLKYLACKSAIKAGEVVSKEQIKTLLEQLAEFPNAYTCPHGRPIKQEIPLSQLDKLFKRR